MKNIKSNAKGLSIAFIAAVVADYLHLPLPWLLGPLLAILTLGTVGYKVQCDPRWRKCGQLIIGMTLALYFTSELGAVIRNYWAFILIGLVWAIVLNVIFAYLHMKINHLDWATAWFSSSIGSASEMMTIAEKYHAEIDKVVAAHSLRIVLLVVLIPIVMVIFLEVDFSQIELQEEVYFSHSSVLLIFLIGLAMAKIFDHYNVLNAWLLGPLLSIGFLSFVGVLNLKLPNWIICFGQVCIGWSLGSKLPFDFLQFQKRFIIVTIGLNFIALLLSISLAALLSYFSGVDLKVLILGFSPGGIAEMSLTAKAISIAVPTVVAFQLSRLIFVIMTTQFFYQYFKKSFAKMSVR